MTNGKILIELDEAEGHADVASAPEIDAPEGQAMQMAVAGMAKGRPAGPGRWALAAGGGLVSLVMGVAAYDFAMRLIERVPVLGWLAAILAAVLVGALVLWAGKEALGYVRVRRLDTIRQEAEKALATHDLKAARAVAVSVAGLYGAKDPTEEALDAEAVIEGAEAHLLIGLDARAQLEIQQAARQVAMATALIPLAFADVAAALTANLRMIRRIAEIYGGRPGAFGNWRLARSVAVHLMATGVVAVGDDLVGSLAGGGLLSKLSRRFGEGVVNGALTARVGLAAMELCRPLPFRMARKPAVTTITATALRGLFDRS
ncbi:YcjF family protein [Pararhodobacter sp. CCB-MM2]|uniref:YcjF family protein n=1 Tax=Pararhodobacter sp. CCB-MM2 TaxID=1786003 RepID=UPI00083206A1|nr:TIGR01620 family protein [Pararhodobacter sp. CCB-MM2]